MPDTKQMTPEQRARMEATIKNLSGAHTSTVRTCVTREGIDKAIARASSTPSNSCAPRLVNSSASKVDLHIECSQERGSSRSSGDVTIERKDPTHFTGSGIMKSNGVNGRPVDMKWSMAGKYISGDCSALK